MIVEPFNDTTCLGAATSLVVSLVEARDPDYVALATRFATTAELAAWIRSLPQRDDEGDPAETPKVEACEPRQRLRSPLHTSAPNCFERSNWYMLLAELIDPGPVRCLRTEVTAAGAHTFVMEDGEPVTLDPTLTRNALRGAIANAEQRDRPDDGEPVRIPITQAIDMVAELAHGRAIASNDTDGAAMVERARVAMRAATAGAHLAPRAIREVAVTLALAEREARAWGAAGVAVVQRTADVLIERTTHTRNLSVRVGGYTIRPDWDKVGKVARVAGRLGERAGTLALRSYLAPLGIGAPLLGEVEGQLAREGLTLGRLATEPAARPGTIAAYAAAVARRRA